MGSHQPTGSVAWASHNQLVPCTEHELMRKTMRQDEVVLLKPLVVRASQ